MMVKLRYTLLAHKLAHRISSLRKSCGFLQEELAKRAGISASYLSLIERGHRFPTIFVLFQLAYALEISVHELLMFRRKEKKPGLIFSKVVKGE